MPIKGNIYYRDCAYCETPFPWKDTAKVRSAYSVDLKRMVGSVHQKYCSQTCSLRDRNENFNPSKTEEGKAKISEFAKSRGTLHLNTEKSREKQSLAIRGENHWNWQGGKTKETTTLRMRKETKEWRKAVFERDEYTCQICGERGGELNADHIKPWSLFPELRWEVHNGRTLCLSCHRKTDTYMGRVRRFSREDF